MKEPVSALELSFFVRTDPFESDFELEALITAARLYLEQATGRKWAGEGAEEDERARIAIKQLVAFWFESREAVATGRVAPLPMHCRALIHQLTDFSKLDPAS